MRTRRPETNRRFMRRTALLAGLAVLAAFLFAAAARRRAADPNELIRRFEGGDHSCYADSRWLTHEELAQYSVGDPARGSFMRCDLDGDGVDELLWNDLTLLPGMPDTTRIKGIFTCKNGAVSCIFLDLNDSSEFLFLGQSGRLVYTAPNYGTYLYENYDCVTFTPNGQYCPLYRLEIYNIYSMEEVNPNWGEIHPNMTQPGIYCKKVTRTSAYGEVFAGEEAALTLDEFKDEYQALTGFAYESSAMMLPIEPLP